MAAAAPFIIPILASVAGAAASYGFSKLGESGSGDDDYKVQQHSTETKEQKALNDMIDQYLKTGEGPLKDVFPKFDQKGFEKGVAQPAISKFRDETLPQILEKYSRNQSFGSGMLNAEMRGARDLQSDLNKQEYQEKSQADRDRSNAVLQLLGIRTGKTGVENVVDSRTNGPTAGQGALKGLAEQIPGLAKQGFESYQAQNAQVNANMAQQAQNSQNVYNASTSLMTATPGY